MEIMKIIGIYKITNTITNDSYIGSSKDVKRRWRDHKKISVWRKCPSNQMYLDMKKYGLDKFEFEILEEVEVDSLKEKEQQFIEKLKPTYNSNNAKGLDIDKYKDYQKSDKRKESKRKYDKQPCSYNGKILTLQALYMRFRKAGIENPTKEAKKYLLKR